MIMPYFEYSPYLNKFGKLEWRDKVVMPSGKTYIGEWLVGSNTR
jgi:hypothetical protein